MNGTDTRVDLREYLAAERTLLAYIRTALSLMAFGFVVARFSLFLRELVLVKTGSIQYSGGLSLWFGTALMLGGVALSAGGAYEYRNVVRQLNRFHQANQISSRLAVGTAAGLAIFGIGMAGYLLWLH